MFARNRFRTCRAWFRVVSATAVVAGAVMNLASLVLPHGAA